MQDETEAADAVPPNAALALDQIEEWAAVLAIEIGAAVTAKLLRRIALEVEDLPTALVQ